MKILESTIENERDLTVEDDKILYDMICAKIKDNIDIRIESEKQIRLDYNDKFTH